MSYYSPQGDYAKLGATCCTSMSVLLSNAKFIPLNDPIYKMFYTESRQYPGPSIYDSGQPSQKDPEEKQPVEKFSKKGCCNR